MQIFGENISYSSSYYFYKYLDYYRFIFLESYPSEEFLTTVVFTMSYLVPIMHVITLVLSFILPLIGDTLTKSFPNKTTALLIKLLLSIVPISIPLLWTGNSSIYLIPLIILFLGEIALEKLTSLRYLGFATLACYMVHLLLVLCTFGLIVLVISSGEKRSGNQQTSHSLMILTKLISKFCCLIQRHFIFMNVSWLVSLSNDIPLELNSHEFKYVFELLDHWQAFDCRKISSYCNDVCAFCRHSFLKSGNLASRIEWDQRSMKFFIVPDILYQ